jgi:hypothetical protein
MDNETYESQSHWGMFRVAECEAIIHNVKQDFTPLSAYKERIEMIPIVEVRV